MRNAELERGIVAAPDDPTARMVYGDWLQDQGSALGPWVAMWSAVEQRPDDLVLRGQALEYQGDHQGALFGDGLDAIRRGYVGWKGGFVDELRIVTADAPTLDAIAALFALPIMRFVHHVAIEDIAVPIADVVDALVAAELPLLDELVVYDAVVDAAPVQVDAIARLPLRRLALSNVTVGPPMPTLRELVVTFGRAAAVAWIRGGGCPGLQQVTFVDAGEPEQPALDVPATYLAGLDVYGMPADVAHNPLEDLVRAGDRARLRMIPGAGVPIYNLGTTYLTTDGRLRDAIAFCDLAATLPAGRQSHALNAAIAHEKAGEPAQAELYARAALLTQPGDEGFYEILIDALRQQRRFADAFRLWPKVKAALANPLAKDEGRDRACLLDLMLTCVLAGKPEEVAALAKEFPALVDDQHQALFAIVALEAGETAAARAAWARVKTKTPERWCIVDHARVLFGIDKFGPLELRVATDDARRAGYTDLAWLADTARRAQIRNVHRVASDARAKDKPKTKSGAKPKAKPKARAKPKR